VCKSKEKNSSPPDGQLAFANKNMVRTHSLPLSLQACTLCQWCVSTCQQNTFLAKKTQHQIRSTENLNHQQIGCFTSNIVDSGPMQDRPVCDQIELATEICQIHFLKVQMSCWKAMPFLDREISVDDTPGRDHHKTIVVPCMAVY